MTNMKLEEYRILRNEIDHQMQLHNSLLTFTITTSVAIITIGFTTENTSSFIFLMPLCIIIPLSMRIAYYRSAMAKISAYMIVFLEPEIGELNWETRNAIYLAYQKSFKPDSTSILSKLRYQEGFILSIICYCLYLYASNPFILQQTFSYTEIVHIVLPIPFVILEGLITTQINSVDKARQDWIIAWKNFKDMEELNVPEAT